MPKIHIDEVYPKGSIYPMIVNFQNGYATDEFQSNTCLLLQDKESEERTVTVDVAGLVYSGKEDKEQIGKTFMLLRNKSSGKVRLIEVGNVELKPTLKENLDKSKPEIDTSVLELSRKFGSKKQKKHVEHREKLKMNVQTVTEQMHNITVNVTEEQLDLSSYVKADSDDFYIPPINRDANRPEDVYDLYKILSKEEYETVIAEIEGKDYTADLLPWIKDMISKRTLSNEHTVLAIYASSLLKLFPTVIREIQRKNFAPCPISATLNNIILKNFTTCVNGKRNRSLQYKDKSLCHGLAFLLLVNNLKCDLEQLSKNIKYSAKTMSTKFRLIGATIVTSGNNKIAQLKLPLASVANARRRSAKF